VGDGPAVNIPLLSVVVPVKNEEDAILPFVTRVGAILDRITETEG